MRKLLIILPLLAAIWAGAALAAPPGSPMNELVQTLGSPAKRDLPQMRKLGIVRVLTEYSHTYFFLRHGRPYGLDYALLEKYQHALNYHRPKHLPPLEVVFIPVPFDRVLPLLEQGYGDMAAAGITITPERAKRLVFTKPYITGVDEVVVSHRSVKGLASLEDLSGRRVLVGRGSSYVASLAKLNHELRAKGRKPVQVVLAPELLTDEDILDLVNAGVAKLTVVDSPVAGAWAGVMPNLVVHAKLALRRGGGLGWLVRPDSPELLASLNRFLVKHRQGTLTGNVLFKRYFKDNRWLRNPNDSRERERFTRYAPLFQKYAKEYGFDWLFLAAQAFQESRLDPDCVSKQGAVGLMQVVPTGKGERREAEAKRLRQPEYNIKAGVSYMAHLRSRYFDQAGMNGMAKFSFCLAAYNAGPGAINRVRAASPKLGYDPDLWFFNCEYGALRLVSSEPVHYVRNVLKYYVSYRLSDRDKDASYQEVIDLMRK